MSDEREEMRLLLQEARRLVLDLYRLKDALVDDFSAILNLASQSALEKTLEKAVEDFNKKKPGSGGGFRLKKVG